MLILASTSPRRKELLKSIRISSQIAAPHVDEKPQRGEAPRHLVRRLAFEKAKSVAKNLIHSGTMRLILAADTIVLSPQGNKILGKPKDKKEAFKMLSTLAGKTHTVLTAYCIFPVGKGEKSNPLIRIVCSRVTMRDLTASAIRNYIRLDKPFDKAGSYAAQGLGMALILRISGSYTNVVGLPVAQLLLDLEREFGISPFLE